MTLLATTSSTTGKKISKQGFHMSKFRTPVDAVIFSLGMWWISDIAHLHSLLSADSEKILQSTSNHVAKRSFLYSSRVKGYINSLSHERKGGCYQEWNALTCCYVSAKRLTIQDKKLSIRFIKIFSGIFANRVKNAKLFTSYSGEAFLHPNIKEVRNLAT